MESVADTLVGGQALELVLDGDPTPLTAFVFGTTPREILLTLGQGEEAPPALVAGATVTMRFVSGLGLHETRTRVVHVVHDRTVKLGVAQVNRPSVVQRRRYFRVSAALAARATIADSISAPSIGYHDGRAITRDISAGGLCLETSLRVGLGDELSIVLETPRGLRKNLAPELSCRARVLRIQETSRGRRILFLLGLELMFPLERERDRWVQLTFDLQRGVQP
jgi:c-di-GMP-binding flagellar brake protein YcgR